jgi:hypothetical protein
MVTLYRTGRWKIAVYVREHGVPHFHIEGPTFRCSVSIADLEVIVGTMPAAVRAEALRWASDNRSMLMQTWKDLNE